MQGSNCRISVVCQHSKSTLYVLRCFLLGSYSGTSIMQETVVIQILSQIYPSRFFIHLCHIFFSSVNFNKSLFDCAMTETSKKNHFLWSLTCTDHDHQTNINEGSVSKSHPYLPILEQTLVSVCTAACLYLLYTEPNGLKVSIGSSFEWHDV